MGTTGLAFSHEHHKAPLTKQKQRSINNLCSCSTNLLVSLFTTIVTLLILFQIQSTNLPSSSSSPWLFFRNSATSSTKYPCSSSSSGDGSCCSQLENARSRLRDSAVLRPTKDRSIEHKPFDNNTFFLSSIDYTHVDAGVKYVNLPANVTDNRLLCITGDNRYTLAWPDALPRNATMVAGLTFICDTYFLYDNIWHALCALVPFGWWLGRNCGAVPDRWVLYRHAELTNDLGHWARKIMGAMTGREVVLMEDFTGGPKCFEKALVFRNNEGKIKKMERRAGYDLIRCKAREYCGITPEEVASDDPEAVRLTLLLRVGNRAFKDDRAVIRIFETECSKIKGCSFTVRWGDNMTFCEQVRVLSKTDVMASQHGAQMTNFVFMEKNSSIMEMYPKGWKEYGGTGQFVFHWMADWAGMRHVGEWRDTEGPDCPYKDRMQCFFFHKNQNLSTNATSIANWTAGVLRQVKEYKISKATERNKHSRSSCPCS